MLHLRTETTPFSHPMVNRRVCYFKGRVQGVGFRYTVSNLAMCYHISGYVRNLADGRVELVLEGSDADMDHLIEQIHRKMDGFIRNAQVTTEPATGEFKQFSIRH